MSTGDEPVAVLENVTFSYPDTVDTPPALEDVNLEILPRDFIGLIGPNGGGKTTLLRILLGLLTPTHGRVRFLGRPPRESSRQIGYVPQNVLVDPQVPATVEDVVRTGRLGSAPVGFRYGADDVRAARDAMAEAGVADLSRRRIGELSGGQRQRVLIARALASEAKLLLLDEPMAGVDLHMEQGIVETLVRLNEKMPVVLVSHDVGFVSAHVDRVACLNRRLVVNRAEEVTQNVIAEMYAEQGNRLAQMGHGADCPLHHPAGRPGPGKERA